MSGTADGSLSEILGTCLESLDRGEEPEIDALCGGDPKVAAAVRERLALCRAIDDAIGVDTPPQPAPAQGEVIGGWQLGRPIGEGGFGSVYEARRVDGHEDLAAVKLLHHGALSPEARSRFRTEAHALAVVRHPNVASILDSGVTESGTPYLVLELIDGSAIDAYCRAHSLGTPERVRLMLTVCRTIEHAHAKGVLHRDLKPSNVLVMRVGGAHVPKVIDFGIARFIEGIGPDRTRVTAEGQVLGTARYMSPEQLGVIEGSPDTRSDIYSLGVMLYELVAGVLPYESSGDKISSVYELQQRMRSSEPRGLTSRHIRDGAVSARELGWIVMRCLEVDPSRRYATCRELADDLERLVSGEAVHAGPRSRVYLARKFAARHRGLVGVVSAACVGLMVAAVGTSWGLVQARAETARAVAAEADSQRIIDFQYNMLRNLDPSVVGTSIAAETLARTAPDTPGGSEELAAAAASVIDSLSMTDVGTRVLGTSVFDPAIARIDRDFADAPPLQGKLLNSIGKAQVETGLIDEGLVTYRRAYELLDNSLGPDAEQTLLAKRDYADALRQANRPGEALVILEGVATALESHRGRGDPDTILAIIDEGTAFYNSQQLHEAEERWRTAFELGMEHLGKDDEITGVARGNLGLVLTDLGDHERAEGHLRAMRSHWIDRSGLDHHQTIISSDNLARCLALQGNYDEALGLYRDTIERAEKLLGATHHDTIRIRGTHIRVMTLAGNYDAALSASERHLESIRASLPADHPSVVAGLYGYGRLLIALDRHDEAESILGPASRDADRVFGAETPYGAQLRVAHAEALAGTGRYEEAIRLFDSAYDVLASQLGESHPETAQAAELAVRVLKLASEGSNGSEPDPRLAVWRARVGEPGS